MNLLALIVVALGIALALAFGLRRGAAWIEERRTVVVHAPPAAVWEGVRHAPALLGRFGKLRDHARLDAVPDRPDATSAPGPRLRLEGFWEGAPYWVEIDLRRVRPERELTLRLARDAFGTERGLGGHQVSLTLEAADGDRTKLSLHLRARLRGPRLLLANLLAPRTLRARLLDLKLRAIKVAVERELAEREARAAGAVAARPADPGTELIRPASIDPPDSRL